MILLFYCSAFLASVIGQGCEEGWFENPKAGACYNITWDMKNERGYNWTQAKSVCIELNAELASFMSAEENEFIMDYLRNRTDMVGPNRTWADSIDALWIGASDIGQPLGSFVWTDGSKLNFTNWWKERDCPLKYAVPSCVAMLPKNANGQWYNAKNCATRVDPPPALCQKPAVYKCGDGWTRDPATGSCFQILSDELSWEDAKEQCISLDKGSDLASIHTEQENEFVKSLLRENDSSPGVQGFWTGGNDLKDEGSWVWTDESPVEFADWHNGQGNPTKNKDCITMWKSFDYEWKDWQCKMTLPSVCKIENRK